VARRATAIRQERETAAHVLVLDAGDTLISDRPLALMSESQVVVQAMNLMGYDAMTLGEGDLGLGADVLRQRMAEAEFAFLSANVEFNGELFAQPYLIKEVGGYQVAIVGLTGVPTSEVGSFVVRDPLLSARDVVGQLESQADIIILLVHVGQRLEQQLISQVEGIDIIVGGSGEPRSSSAAQDESTGVLVLPSERPATGHAGRFLGVSRLTFDGQGALAGYASLMLGLRPEVVDDPELAALVLLYQQGQ
jgi:2',3'-cyclic-nucleotide 2'-phosphodiesterase (5'-nucleotidase family)